MLNSAIFITGTDTNVGKTTMTGALLLALQQQGQSVGMFKPVETGVAAEHREQSDTERMRLLLSPPPSFDSVCLYAFPQPLAPLAAARATGTTIDLSLIRSQMDKLAQQHSFLLIEGAGGLFTPLTPTDTIRDCIKLLDVPCLIVGRTSLGGINHCLLTMEALQHAGIPLSGIILNEPSSQYSKTSMGQQQQQSTIELIQEWSSVPVFGPIGFSQTVGRNWQEGVKQLAEDSEIQRLATHLSERGTEIA
ncbi:MAG: dethiobiotin synthase [Nitrospirota bacterium]|nr:dethiobiotin synthase [Nitrospirota bacterium]